MECLYNGSNHKKEIKHLLFADTLYHFPDCIAWHSVLYVAKKERDTLLQNNYYSMYLTSNFNKQWI